MLKIFLNDVNSKELIEYLFLDSPAAEVSEESRQLKVQLIKQREEDIQRKIKLIQEIKTIQSLRALPFKDFDPTESSGLGLLCEMSLTEVHIVNDK